ncbi:MAG: ABC transporter ATP-binding protein [Bacilli bacterium]|nr:ABC transporter ATP-binding protein [Bacilli bacterium]
MIELRNINKIYTTNNREKFAVKDISIKIDKGEFVGIIGPSGAGKSTLLHILSCVDSPTTGVYLFNENIVDFKKQKELSQLRNSTFGICLQNLNLIESYTVFENVLLPLHFSKRKDKKTKYEAVINALEFSNILFEKDSFVKKLSSGEKQRVGIARAIVNNPEVIFLDEPTSSLDNQTKMGILMLLKELNEIGKTIVVATHDVDVINYCTRIIKLDKGEIIN